LEQDRYTLTYRAAETRQVMDWIKAGQSGCLIGLRGAGKSNFLRFLLRSDVQQHYLKQDRADFLFILINLLSLTERAEWAVYESILDRLANQLCLSGVEGQSVEEITSLHWDVIRSKDPLIGRRVVERCVNILCQQLAQRLILLFDEFDAAFRTLDPSLFRCLRSIRDAHKDQISYIVVVANDLAYLRDALTEVEHFYRLVNRNVCGLGPYSQADARRMIHHLVSLRSVEMRERDVTHLIELSGGHAGLLKATLSLLWDTRQRNSLEELVPTLKDEPSIQAECRKVWDSLPEDEQIALCTLENGAKVPPQILCHLQYKGLVREDEAQLSLFSPLFTHFVRQQSLPSKERVTIDRPLGVAMVDGRRVELTELEFEMLCYLYEHRGQVCTKDELIENVYRQQYDRRAGSIDDARLQTLIFRLRSKIEPPRYIVTIRGEGYKFVEPDER
jgi:hypothetical protein